MLLKLDFQSAVPIYRQIRDEIVRAIAEGRLQPGERLPAIRPLAEDAGVNTMTVSKAYQLLKAEGYLATDRRSGAVVCLPGRPAGLNAQQLGQLRLLAAEARLSGMSCEDFTAVCRQLYHETEGQ